MIVGVGSDLVEVARMEVLVARWGNEAGRRLLTTDERENFLTSAHPARFLAKRFAAKEALAKALGVGLRAPVLCRSIGVANDTLGKPIFVLSPDLEKYLRSRGVQRQHVSISDERHYALAFVVLETSEIT